MIKFIKERYSSTDAIEDDANESTASRPALNPELNHSTVALRQLRQTEDEYDSMKRRLSVLEIKEKKNMGRALENQRKALFHARVQDEINQEKRRKNRYNMQMR